MTLSSLPATAPDLLRLLAIPVFAWAAWTDVRTRRITATVWIPLAALGLVLLVWDGLAAHGEGDLVFAEWLVPVVISLGLVGPLAYLFWWIGGFGGADAKAILVLALLFPTAPAYAVGDLTIPAATIPEWAFSFTILTNAVVVAVVAPVALALGNALAGRFTLAMFVGWPVSWETVETTHGRLLETPRGRTRDGLDLDALRMYCCWRGLSLSTLRADPDRYRDPSTLPAEPNPPTDGAVVRYRDALRDSTADGGVTVDDGDAEANEHDDPWGAAAFLNDVEGSAYGTDPTTLRDGLDVLVERESVWVSPGTPFLVPIFAGLLVALTVGDVLLGLLV